MASQTQGIQQLLGAEKRSADKVFINILLLRAELRLVAREIKKNIFFSLRYSCGTYYLWVLSKCHPFGQLWLTYTYTYVIIYIVYVSKELSYLDDLS